MGQLECPACRSLSPVGSETCSECGEPLTLFGRVIERQGNQSLSRRQSQMRERAGQIKENAQISSEQRMAGFREIDDRRLEAERQDMLAQHDRDRRLFRSVAIGLGVFLIVVAIMSLISLL